MVYFSLNDYNKHGYYEHNNNVFIIKLTSE